MELSQKTIDGIARRTAEILLRRMAERQEPPMATTREAAAILRISPARMRQIAARYPHIKTGNGRQGKLLFYRDALLTQHNQHTTTNKTKQDHV